MLELGASFKKARESRSVSIDSIANQTRISSRFLLAIENEQFELLPGGVFNRGFIRTYAECLGLDPEESIQTYEKLSRTVEVEPVRHEAERVKRKTTRIPVYYVAIAGLSILFAVYYLASRHTELTPITASAPPTSSPPEPPVPKVEEVAVPEPVAAADPNSPTIVATAAALPGPAIPVTPPLAPSPIPNNSVTTAPVVLELEVREESWFKVSTDGTPVVMGEMLPAGTKRRYTANSSMDVSIGNAAGVAVRVNGEPVSSLGRAGQVRNLTITPKTTAGSLSAK